MAERRTTAALTYPHVVEQRIGELTKPLKEELRGIDRRLEELDKEQKELRAARRRIEGVLKQLDPGSFVSKPKRNGGVSPNWPGSDEMKNAKRRAMEAFLNENRAKYEEGLIAAELYRDMKAAGVEPISGPSAVLGYLRELHANGVLRADKKVKGGAVSYKFISNGGSDGKA